MRAEDFEYLYNLEESFWWFVAMRKITDTIVSKKLREGPLRILDAGCGTGYNVRHYEGQGHDVFAFDISDHAIAGVKRRGFSKVCRASVTDIPYRSSTFDLVFSFEVVDELSSEKAAQAVNELHRVLKPGGALFMRLPALEWMRSSHDDDIATAHRYTLPEMRTMLEQGGFHIELASYANSLLFPIVLLRRSLKRLGVGRGTDVKPLPAGLGWIDPLFRKVLTSEARVLGANRSFPIGLSAICYARK
jgi:SAM-dependent methyltransferase